MQGPGLAGMLFRDVPANFPWVVNGQCSAGLFSEGPATRGRSEGFTELSADLYLCMQLGNRLCVTVVVVVVIRTV